MAGLSPIEALLGQANQVFTMALALGRAFEQEHHAARGEPAADSWSRYEPAFDQFSNALLDLRDAIQNLPADFAPVANSFREACVIAKGIHATLREPLDRGRAAYLEFFPDLISVSDQGGNAVIAACKRLYQNDQFAFGDEAAPRGNRNLHEIDQAKLRNDEVVIVHLVGHLLKALREGRDTGVTVSAIMVGPPAHVCVVEPTFPHGDDQAKVNSLERVKALLVAEGGQRPEVLEKLVGSVAFHLDVSQASVLNMPLAEFVRAVRSLHGVAPWAVAESTPATASNGDAGLATLARVTSEVVDVAPSTPIPKVVRTKRSSQKGDGQAKLGSALVRYHQYDNGSALNHDPVGSNELARMASVDKSTASAFFKKQFKGYPNYRAMCGDSAKLVASLKMLNGEFSPHVLLRDGGESLEADAD